MKMIIISISLIMIGLASIFSMYRIFKGPSAADRVVAVDIMTTITAGLMVLFSLYYDRPIFLDVALVYAVLAFLGVIVFARYLEDGL